MLRFQMYKIMKALENAKDFILTKDELARFNEKAIYALQAVDAIKIFSADDEIQAIAMNKKGHIYILSRYELWINRIGAFICGVATTLIAQHFIVLLR